MTYFEEVFERIRKEVDIKSQNELANILNVDQSQLSKVKSEGRFPEKWSVLICDIFNLDMNFIIRGKTSLNKHEVIREFLKEISPEIKESLNKEAVVKEWVDKNSSNTMRQIAEKKDKDEREYFEYLGTLD